MSCTTAILHLFSQETDILIKVIIKRVNIKLWDILGCFHYILNPPRMSLNIHGTKYGITFYKTLKFNWLCSKTSKCNVIGSRMVLP